MRQFVLGLAVGAAAALLGYWSVSGVSPAAAQPAPPGRPPGIAPNPADPAPPPPLPAARQPVGTYQVATSQSSGYSTGGNSYISGSTILILVDTRTGEGYRLKDPDRWAGKGFRTWEKYINGPPR